MESKTVAAYLSLGTNIEPAYNLKRAIRLLKERSDVHRISSVWETPAIGSAGPNFLNAVVLLYTELSASDLKSKLISPLEAELGRVRTSNKFAPRTIDIDILIHNNVLLDKDAFKQVHLAVPLADLYPEYRHPDQGIRLIDVSEKLRVNTSISMQSDFTLD